MPKWEVCRIAFVPGKGNVHDIAMEPRQFEGLIAQLGLDSWEPMPLVIVGGSQYSTSSHVEWYLKRQVPA